MIIPLQEQLLHKIPQLPSLLCKLRAVILDFILTSWLFLKLVAEMNTVYDCSSRRSIFTLRPIQRISSFTLFIQYPYPFPMKTILAQKCQICPFQYMQINGSHLEFFYCYFPYLLSKMNSSPQNTLEQRYWS